MMKTILWINSETEPKRLKDTYIHCCSSLEEVSKELKTTKYDLICLKDYEVAKWITMNYRPCEFYIFDSNNAISRLMQGYGFIEKFNYY